MNRYFHAYGLTCLLSAVALMGIVFLHIFLYGRFVGAEADLSILLFEGLLLFPSSVGYLGYLWYDKLWKKEVA